MSPDVKTCRDGSPLRARLGRKRMSILESLVNFSPHLEVEGGLDEPGTVWTILDAAPSAPQGEMDANYRGGSFGGSGKPCHVYQRSSKALR